MSIDLETLKKINGLKQAIETATGETYTDLTAAVQGLKNGYGQGGDEELVKALVENDEFEALDLPDYVTKIKPFAFYNSKLKGIRGFEVTELTDRMEEWFDEETGETEIYPAYNNAFDGCAELLFFHFPKLEYIGIGAFQLSNLEEVEELPDSVKYIGSSAFNSSMIPLTKLPENLEEIGGFAFGWCPNLAITEIPASVKNIYYQAFIGCPNLSTITFKGKPDFMGDDVFGLWWAEDPEEAESFVTTINVPWAEGEVAGSPWGAIGATINYNYTGG